MALNSQISDVAANAALDALTALLNGGFMRIYSGPQPDNANGGTTGANTLLASCALSNPAFQAAVSGVAVANAIDPDPNAANTGTAEWYRLVRSNGTTVVADGSIGTSGANINLNTTSITAGTTVTITGFSMTLPEA